MQAQGGGSLTGAGSHFDAWPGPGGSPCRTGVLAAPQLNMQRRTWVGTRDETGVTINFLYQANLAVSSPALGDHVYALGRVSRAGGPANQSRLFAFARAGGACVWSVPVATPVLDSYAGPVLDVQRAVVIVGSGQVLAAHDARSGDLVWSRTLDRAIVNATPVITTDRPGRDRLFITDYDGFGSGGSLYCINVDPFDPAHNPFSPGEIVYQVGIGGSSGNSPAYLPASLGGLGLVYVASPGDFGAGMGRIFAFPVEGPPVPVWVFENVIGTGFFGGVCVAPPSQAGQPPHVYAASYAFSGGHSSANIVKIDGATGALRWSAPSNRTSATPVVLPGGRVLVSGGIQGFGTVPSLRLYEDHGTFGVPVWDSALDTWQDLNANGLMDLGEYLRVGGWTQQPVAMIFAGRTHILAGVVPAGQATQPSPELFLIDVDAMPGSSGFVIGTHTGAGGSPAPAGVGAYSVGASGLIALGPDTGALDGDADGVRTVDDLYAWEASRVDVDGDGVPGESDRLLLIGIVRLGDWPAGRGGFVDP
jgi:outer membrane protein assembly factor BamB